MLWGRAGRICGREQKNEIDVPVSGPREEFRGGRVHGECSGVLGKKIDVLGVLTWGHRLSLFLCLSVIISTGEMGKRTITLT